MFAGTSIFGFSCRSSCVGPNPLMTILYESLCGRTFPLNSLRLDDSRGNGVGLPVDKTQYLRQCRLDTD
ncbi:hypothetical protein DPMN_079786 [Dreissena polymorpha]|uniref:Uncharacterized protein n=1 Tax=Dreissena polymorpha TaxID=45954 RepID=A0A9D3YTS9_DREPO|nr:hypothetical protein DPMN_079786 [Dreissena polymorpha]